MSKIQYSGLQKCKPEISRARSYIRDGEEYRLWVPDAYIMDNKFWRLRIAYWLVRLVFSNRQVAP